MLAPSTITVRRPSGESDFILTRVDPSAGSSDPKSAPEVTETDLDSVPFQRPKANSASCIIDGIKASHFLSTMGAYMIRPEEYFLTPAPSKLFGFQPTPYRKSSWQASIKKDLGKIKEHTISYVKGSMDSLLSRISNYDSDKNKTSEFLFAPNGLILEILPQESTASCSKKTRNSKPPSQSPVNKPNVPVAKSRNHSIPIEGRTDVSYETLHQHLSRLDDIISKHHRKSSIENQCRSICHGKSTLEQPKTISDRVNAHSSIQVCDDFSQICPDKSFNCPLQGVCIYDGHFKGYLPLSSFPLGHICLKVRGYRLEIALLIGNIEHFEITNPSLKTSSHIFQNSTSKDCPSKFGSRSFRTTNSTQPEAKHSATRSEKQKRGISNSNDRLLGINYLGSVSIPIFVEPCSLQFCLDDSERWLKIDGLMKGCISSSCLNLEDDNM